MTNVDSTSVFTWGPRQEFKFHDNRVGLTTISLLVWNLFRLCFYAPKLRILDHTVSPGLKSAGALKFTFLVMKLWHSMCNVAVMLWRPQDYLGSEKCQRSWPYGAWRNANPRTSPSPYVTLSNISLQIENFVCSDPDTVIDVFVHLYYVHNLSSPQDELSLLSRGLESRLGSIMTTS